MEGEKSGETISRFTGKRGRGNSMGKVMKPGVTLGEVGN